MLNYDSLIYDYCISYFRIIVIKYWEEVTCGKTDLFWLRVSDRFQFFVAGKSWHWSLWQRSSLWWQEDKVMLFTSWRNRKQRALAGVRGWRTCRGSCLMAYFYQLLLRDPQASVEHHFCISCPITQKSSPLTLPLNCPVAVLPPLAYFLTLHPTRHRPCCNNKNLV